MKNYILFTLMCFATLSLKAQYNTNNLKLETQLTSAKYQHGNLQLYPIRANQVFITYHKNIHGYTPLKEALEKKKVVVTEYKNGTVNTLHIENISSDTIMILAGEVIKGGKQDRMVAQDFILRPKSGKKDLSVFCVEHGRWQMKEDGSSFKDHNSMPSNEVRKAGTMKKDQQEVWDKVAETTSKNNAGTSTGTLTALRQSETFTKDLQKYISHFQNLLIGEQDVIGILAVSGDSILGCDMFATHALFTKSYSNLITAYATEAITSGGPVKVPYEKVNQYLLSIISNESKQETDIPNRGTILKDNKYKIHISAF